MAAERSLARGERPVPFEAIPEVTLPDNFYWDVPRAMAQLAVEVGPIFRAAVPADQRALLGPSIVYLVGPEANKTVMVSRREAFSSALGWRPFMGLLPKGLLNMDDPEYAADRRIMNPSFSLAYMERYLDVMNRTIGERIEEWQGREVVDLPVETRAITFDVVVEALTGLKPSATTDHLRSVFERLANPLLDRDDPGTAVGYARELNHIILNLVRERRSAPADDLLSRLVWERDQSGSYFSDQKLVGHIDTVLLAGHETTTLQSAMLLHLLAWHPDHLRAVQGEVDGILDTTGGEVTPAGLKRARSLGFAMHEAGRLLGPAGNLPRVTLQNVEFDRYTIPTGTRLALSVAGGHRLPWIFNDPDVFDPHRFAPPREEDKRTPYSFIPFGAGPRVCIGINFAHIEMKALAMHVLRRYDLAPVPESEFRHLYYYPNASIKGEVMVRVGPRRPA